MVIMGDVLVDNLTSVTCDFCGYGVEVRNICGQLFSGHHEKDGPVTAHHKCLQYSAGLTQYINSHKDFGGFDIKEVFTEIRNGLKCQKKHPCDVCKKIETTDGKKIVATAGCAKASCKKNYHFYCAASANDVITKRMIDRRNGEVMYRVFCSEEHQTWYTTKDKLGKYAENSDTGEGSQEWRCDTPDPDRCEGSQEWRCDTSESDRGEDGGDDVPRSSDDSTHGDVSEQTPHDGDVTDGRAESSSDGRLGSATENVEMPVKPECPSQSSDQPSTIIGTVILHEPIKREATSSTSDVTSRPPWPCDGDECDLEAVYYCHECKEAFCETHTDKHNAVLDCALHQVAPLTDKTFCRAHPRKVVRQWCEQCTVAVCNKCLMDTHSGHQTLGEDDLKDLLTQRAAAEQTAQDIEYTNRMLADCQDRKHRVDNSKSRILTSVDSFRQHVEERYGAISRQLDDDITQLGRRRTALTSKMDVARDMLAAKDGDDILKVAVPLLMTSDVDVPPAPDVTCTSGHVLPESWERLASVGLMKILEGSINQVPEGNVGDEIISGTDECGDVGDLEVSTDGHYDESLHVNTTGSHIADFGDDNSIADIFIHNSPKNEGGVDFSSAGPSWGDSNERGEKRNDGESYEGPSTSYTPRKKLRMA